MRCYKLVLLLFLQISLAAVGTVFPVGPANSVVVPSCMNAVILLFLLLQLVIILLMFLLLLFLLLVLLLFYFWQ